jgi:hypothetical protein
MYHPPTTLTSNSSPAITADLAYGEQGKCGCQTIILSAVVGGTVKWRAAEPQFQPEVENCKDHSNVYKIVTLVETSFDRLFATNISKFQLGSITNIPIDAGVTIMGNFYEVSIREGAVILYRDCEQS